MGESHNHVFPMVERLASLNISSKSPTRASTAEKDGEAFLTT